MRPYDVGVDCHSRFYQVCLRLKGEGDQFRLFEWTVPANVVQ